MAKRTVSFTVTPTDGVKAYLLSVGTTDVPLSASGKGSLPVDTGVKQLLVWRFAGNPGAKLAIVGTASGATVVEVKESVIPPNSVHAAGIKAFTVT